jgi:glycosyltransferase involved in cell wall biosynthesis
MHIGIDASPLPLEPVGAGTYIIQLIRALVEINSEHDLFVFLHRTRLPLFDDLPGGRIKFIPISDSTPALRLIWEQVGLPALARQCELDLLHSLHYTSPYKLPCLSVVTFHDMTFFMYPHLHTISKRLLFPFYIRSSARRANALIAVSETTRRDAIRILAIPEQKIVTIPNGVSSDFRLITDQRLLGECRRKYQLPDNFILFVGTFEPRKNLPLLLRAYRRLLDEDTGHHLVLAGNQGWMTGEVWKTLKDLRLEEFVHLTGYIPLSDLPMIYNLARVFIYPSLYEGFGLPPIEAMACGTPVIASAIPVNQDHIGDAGLLFLPDDEQSLFENLSRLINDRQMQAELSAKGRERSKGFTWRSCALATLGVYQRLATS